MTTSIRIADVNVARGYRGGEQQTDSLIRGPRGSGSVKYSWRPKP